MKKRNFVLLAIGMIAFSTANAQVPWTTAGAPPGYVTTHTVGNCDIDGNLNLGQNIYMKGWIINMAKSPDDLMRSIQGASPAIGLQLCANTATNNGSSIQMNGGTVGNPGLLSYTSYGNIGLGHNFMNYDPPPPLGTGTTWHTNMTISNNGQVTVGHDLWPSSALPGDVLTVKNQMGFNSDVNPRIHGNSKNSALSIKGNGSTAEWDGPVLEMWGPTSIHNGQIRHYSYGSPETSNYYGHMFLNYDPTQPAPNDFKAQMCINKDGKVVIGNELIYLYNNSNPAPGNYRLYVQKGILTERLKVSNIGDVTNWSDFVFNEDYELMPLNKVESYIKANKHLPQIPSAEEVVTQGIDVAEMDAKLLQKIEELTLYVINQQKQIERQQNEIDKMRKRRN